jgi:hypothetical protein
MRIRSFYVWIVLFVSASWMLSACGSSSPTAHNPRPTSVATSTPTPIPTPAPTSLPGMSCGLPLVTNPNPKCTPDPNETPYRLDVETAIAQLQNDEPDLFNGMVILDVGRYRWGVLQRLERMGYCAMWDGDELGVKKDTNDFSSHFHIDSSSAVVLRGPNTYLFTCRPAAFPLTADPLPQRGDCPLPSSRSVGCSRLDAGGQFVALMDTIADEIARDRPDMVHGGIVTEYSNHIPYYEEVTTRLLARGYCAFLDDTDINVKNTNDFSEFYATLLSSGKVRRGLDAYRGSCSPASF